MNRSHAFWSFGFFGAGAFSALLSGLQINAQWQLGLTVPLVLLLTMVFMGRFEAAPSRHVESGNAAPRWSLPTAGIMLLVACCASALLLEGAGIDWSAIYMRDVFQSDASGSALAVSTVALAQACTRFIADRLVERWTPVPVARGLLSVLFVGALLVTVAPHPTWAMVGFALIGVGSSAIFPLAMSAAAQRTDRPAAVNVAALAQTGFVIFLLAPPLLGFVAEHWGIRAAYGVCLPLVALGLLSCSALVSSSRKVRLKPG
jgi:MFS family permease